MQNSLRCYVPYWLATSGPDKRSSLMQSCYQFIQRTSVVSLSYFVILATPTNNRWTAADSPWVPDHLDPRSSHGEAEYYESCMNDDTRTSTKKCQGDYDQYEKVKQKHPTNREEGLLTRKKGTQGWKRPSVTILKYTFSYLDRVFFFLEEKENSI